MHTLLANKAEPYPTHGYTILVAEVASNLSHCLQGSNIFSDYFLDKQ